MKVEATTTIHTVKLEISPKEAAVLRELCRYIGGSGFARDFFNDLRTELLELSLPSSETKVDDEERAVYFFDTDEDDKHEDEDCEEEDGDDF